MARTVGKYRVVATVIDKKKRACGAGHKVGDTFEISVIETGGMCGWLYHDLFPHLVAFQHGGDLPWWKGDVIETYECPDHLTSITLKLERFNRE